MRELTVCSWSLSLRDFAEFRVDAIILESRRVRNGSILLLHDGDGKGRNASRKHTVEATDAIIRELPQRTLTLVPVPCESRALSARCRGLPPEAQAHGIEGDMTHDVIHA